MRRLEFINKIVYRKIKTMEENIMKKNLLAVTLISLITVFCVSVCLAQQDISIESDRQEYDAASNKTIFNGNVKVITGDIKITGKKGFVTMSPEGKPLMATITGAPKVIKTNGTNKQVVTSKVLKYSLLDNVAMAEGDVTTIITQEEKPVAVITSEYQEYNKNAGTMSASKNVKITYKEAKTSSDKAILTLNAAGQPELLKLSGNAILKQDKSLIKASVLDFIIATNELVATGSSYSESCLDDGTTAHIWSDVQQIAKAEKTLIASGNVKVTYQNYVAVGPKAVFLPDSETGKMNKIVMRGLSTIKEGARQVTALKIEITFKPKNFVAEGSVKTKFLQEVQTKPVANKKN